MRLLPYCYERVSSKDQVLTGQGLSDQRSQIVQFLEEHSEKFTEERIFVRDEGVSAFKDANISPESSLGKFLQDVRDGKIGKGAALIVPALDRISRRNAWAESTIQFIVNSDIVIFDISTKLILHKDDPLTKIHVEIIQQRSHNESLMKSVRAKTAWDSKLKNAIEKGEVISNKMPRWLKNVDKKYAVVDQEAERIRNIFNDYINGLSTSEIVRKLDNGWRLVTVSKLLRDRRLVGEHVREGGDVIPNVYPKIIDTEKFEIVKKLLDSRQPATLTKAKDLLANPDEIKLIYQLFEEGLSVGQIVRKIQNDWSTVNVLRVLRDEEVVEKEIVDNLTFKRVSNALTKKGVAKKIRKDITRSENDVITNLFAGNLHCGLCGGRVALHYNHLKTKYISCRNREEKKNCSAKGIQYTHIERNILETVKQVDFNRLVNSQDADLRMENIKSKLKALRFEEQQYIESINQRRLEKKRAGFELDMGLTDVRDSIEELEKELSGEKENIQPNFVFDMEDALNPESLELRAQLRKELKHAVKRIDYTRFDKYIQVRIEYYLDVLRHVLIINNKGGVLVSNISIHEQGTIRTYETPSFSLVENKEKGSFYIDDKYDIDVQDYGLLLNYMEGITEHSVVEYMIANMAKIINKE